MKIGDLITDAEAIAAVEAAGLDLASGKNINVTSILTANNTWSGLTAIFTAGAVLALGDIAYVFTDSELYKTDADSAASMPAIAMATCATTDNNPFEFLLIGFMRFDTWTWTPGSLLYAESDTIGNPGAMTHIAPAGAGDQVQVVGIAITAEIVYFNPSFELVEIA
ncbi:hypothetical protein ES703_38200 [subsurface metagenome]